ncbi:hypothetical protein B0T24DRAFT_665796 [Lasiosphaeria ovina]|uniref:Uncharacterized protein n=1 Tax=Lasiosphaeria ovina TaxID=92902 RepID=A0AAE0KIR9_9PEZI|nr:hypothetical protein B0T24DRAFT_665796 [Lasiosphaeria ovina]
MAKISSRHIPAKNLLTEAGYVHKTNEMSFRVSDSRRKDRRPRNLTSAESLVCPRLGDSEFPRRSSAGAIDVTLRGGPVHKSWTLSDWAMTYTDLPNRLVPVQVSDKDLFKTKNAERRLSHPLGAQDEIDSETFGPTPPNMTSGITMEMAGRGKSCCRSWMQVTVEEGGNRRQTVSTGVELGLVIFDGPVSTPVVMVWPTSSPSSTAACIQLDSLTCPAASGLGAAPGREDDWMDEAFLNPR